MGAPAHLGVDESPVIIAHCHTTQHYTRTRILDHPWCAPKKAKRARIEELRRQNENEAHLMECARAEVIMRDKSFAERARISLRKEENTKLTVVELVEPITAAQLLPLDPWHLLLSQRLMHSLLRPHHPVFSIRILLTFT